MTREESDRTLAEDLLARVAEDWVSASEVISLVGRSGAGNLEDRRDLAIGLICRLIVEGVVVAGDIVGGRHVPWALQPGDAVFRLTQEWVHESDPHVMPGAIMWLDTTPAGQAIGEEIWHREGKG